MSEALVIAADPEQSLTIFKVRVLLVDDQLIIVEAVRRMLSDQPDIEFHYVTDATQALPTALQLQPTVILQDLVMPSIDGFGVIKLYREEEALRHVPVIVLSAKEDPKLKAHSFVTGANDYMVKLPDKLELLARIRYHSGAHISRLQRDQKPLTLLMCDVDFFKLYNDSFGHLAGDLCLKKVAAVLTEHLKRPADLAARYGGEEFAIILPETPLTGALIVAESCRRHLEQLAIENPRADTEFSTVTMSIGVASVVPSASSDFEELIRQADRALYAAKRGGRNRVVNAADMPGLPPSNQGKTAA